MNVNKYMVLYSYYNITGINTGVKLWFQQFVAMFMKRFYNSFRYWVAILWQLIIPILFVVLALVVAKLISQSASYDSNEPSRVLTIKNSAPSHDISFFWADFASLENTFRIKVSYDIPLVNVFNPVVVLLRYFMFYSIMRNN